MSKAAAELAARGLDTVLEPGDPGLQEEVARLNTAVVHRPEVVVGARSTGGRRARGHFAPRAACPWPYRARGTARARPSREACSSACAGSSRAAGVPSAGATLARALAGARWSRGRAHAPPSIAGSYGRPRRRVPVRGRHRTAGGRSHGFGSDYLVAATLVTGAGEVLNVRADQNADVLWALRGGQPQLGVVTEVELRLAELPVLYAGSLFFDEQHIEAGFRGWTAWTQTADPRVTTSIAVVRFPPADAIPPALRGRRVLTLRFAYPGNAVDGARLAAPLRAMAPVYLDQLGALPIADVAHIFNDPPHPVPSWVSAGSLDPRRPGLRVGFAAPRGCGHQLAVSGRRSSTSGRGHHARRSGGFCRRWPDRAVHVRPHRREREGLRDADSRSRGTHRQRLGAVALC